MISAKDTAYPIINDEISLKELTQCFTPSQEEIDFSRKETRSLDTFACMLIMLKTFQRYGYSINISEISKKIIDFICEKIVIKLKKLEISNYDSSRNRRKHISNIKEFFNVNSYNNGGDLIVSKSAYELAKSREDIADIINGVIDTLIRERFELPGFTTLVKECCFQKATVYKEIFENVFKQIDESEKFKLNQILKYSSENTRSDWEKIKFEIPNPKVKSIKKLADLIDYYSKWDTLTKKLDGIPLNKMNQFYVEAKACDLKEISETEIKKRYTLILTLIKMQKSISIDNLVKIFIKEMSKIKASAEKKLQKYIEQNQDKTDKIIKRFSKANDVCANSEIQDPEKISPIKNILSSDSELVTYAKTHSEFGGKKSIRFMATIFKGKKHIFFKILRGC